MLFYMTSKELIQMILTLIMTFNKCIKSDCLMKFNAFSVVFVSSSASFFFCLFVCLFVFWLALEVSQLRSYAYEPARCIR